MFVFLIVQGEMTAFLLFLLHSCNKNKKNLCQVVLLRRSLYHGDTKRIVHSSIIQRRTLTVALTHFHHYHFNIERH